MSHAPYRIGIVGAAGYTGGELLRLLVHHPQLQIVFAQSESQAGKPVTHTHPDLLGSTELHFAATGDPATVDGLFLCGGHGRSAAYLAANPPAPSTRVVDLSRDYRFDDTFVYGLTEANRAAIATTNRVANPGCFATAIQLALLPFLQQDALDQDIHVHALTGSTGAGQRPTPTGHFSQRNNNVSVYKAFRHQHLDEVRHALRTRTDRTLPPVHFLPLRGNFSRGIYATVYWKSALSTADARACIRDCYKTDQTPSFIQVSDEMPLVKQVVGTNNAVLYAEQIDGRLLVVSTIDNLLKGAAGQALQNMNLMLGVPEHTGLRLRSIAY